LRRDADAGIAYRHLDLALASAGFHADRATVGGELDRVRKEIEEHLPDLALVGDERPEVGRQVFGEVDAVTCGPLAHERERAPDRVDEGELARLQLHSAGLALRD